MGSVAIRLDCFGARREQDGAEMNILCWIFFLK